MAKIGFIGLGNIGKGICGNLIKAGHELTIYDRKPDAMMRFEGQAILAEDCVSVCNNSDYIFLSLPNTNVVEETVEEFLQVDMNEKIVIDTSTSFPMSTRILYERIRKAGGNLIDAPLMAGPAEAEAGTLEIVVGGDSETVEKVRFLFEAYCSKVKYVGGSGNGHLAKLAANYCGLMQAAVLATVFPVMENYGLHPDMLYKILNCEALDNWMFRFYAEKYKNRKYPLDFALELGQKDLSYMSKLFKSLNVSEYMLEGALELCQKTLDNCPAGEVPDFSYLCEKMYGLIDECKKE